MEQPQMNNENAKDLFSANRRVANLLDSIQASSPQELDSETVRIVMCTFYAATRELLDLIGDARQGNISRDAFAAAIDNINVEIDTFYNDMKDALLRHITQQ
jgi:hypothetical protein